MYSTPKKNVAVSIDDQWIKGARDMVLGYANNSFVQLMDWFYIWYVQIMPRDLLINQDKMQATYNIEDPK